MNDYINVKVSINGSELKAYSFERMPINIGRVAECQVVLDNAGVSRLHACIEREGDNLRVIDLGSGNGTFVNGCQVEKAWITGSDTVRIGKFALNVRLSNSNLQLQPVSSESKVDGKAEYENQTIELSEAERQKVLRQAKILKANSGSPNKKIQRTGYLPWLLLFVVGVSFGLLVSWIFS